MIDSFLMEVLCYHWYGVEVLPYFIWFIPFIFCCKIKINTHVLVLTKYLFVCLDQIQAYFSTGPCIPDLFVENSHPYELFFLKLANLMRLYLC